MVEKYTQNYDIIDSGSISSFDSKSNIGFKLKIENQQINIVFNFSEDVDTNKLGLKTVVDKDNGIIIECINFNNPIGAGTVKAIELATVNGKKLYINFNVSKLNNGPHLINYTFYIER